jgi:hypothetical protein
MSYNLKLETIKSVKELFDFREELKSDYKKYNDLWILEKQNLYSENIDKCRDIRFFIDRVEAQIEYFERIGVLLTSIEVTKTEAK